MQATTAARGEEKKKKPRGEVVKYPRDFLMKFAQVPFLFCSLNEHFLGWHLHYKMLICFSL